MSSTKILFTVDERCFIEFLLRDSYTELNCCDNACIALHSPKQCYILGFDSVKNNLHIFKVQIEKALHGELSLHSSLKLRDIGYLYNEELQGKPGLSYKKWQGFDHWVGHDYMLWEGLLITWIYNDVHGDIMLEITPVWPSKFMSSQKGNNDQGYDEWIQHYSPCLMKKIPKDIAKHWLEQTNKILKHIESNVEKEFAQERKKKP